LPRPNPQPASSNRRRLAFPLPREVRSWPVKSLAHYFIWLACGICSVFQRASDYSTRDWPVECEAYSTGLLSAFLNVAG
jgi:hypothetical protein